MQPGPEAQQEKHTWDGHVGENEQECKSGQETGHSPGGHEGPTWGPPQLGNPAISTVGRRRGANRAEAGRSPPPECTSPDEGPNWGERVRTEGELLRTPFQKQGRGCRTLSEVGAAYVQGRTPRAGCRGRCAGKASATPMSLLPTSL